MSETRDWLNEPYLSPHDRSTVMAIEWLLPILYFARHRPDMYFRPIGPMAVIHWASGLYTGLSLWGVVEESKHRDAAVERRGLEARACWNEDDLEKRGLTPAEIADELLAIEIERWEAHRAEILNAASEAHRQIYPGGIKPL
mgnify:CR=1 FL=1